MADGATRLKAERGAKRVASGVKKLQSDAPAGVVDGSRGGAQRRRAARVVDEAVVAAARARRD